MIFLLSDRQKNARCDLLILDEPGNIPFSREGVELLFQVLAERHEKGSVIIPTEWTQVFGETSLNRYFQTAFAFVV